MKNCENFDVGQLLAVRDARPDLLTRSGLPSRVLDARPGGLTGRDARPGPLTESTFPKIAFLPQNLLFSSTFHLTLPKS